MANRFWIGNSGNWNDPDHWATESGGSGPQPPPLAEDDVAFDANSFSIASQTVNLNVDGVCRILDFRDVVNSPTFAGTNSLTIGDGMMAGLYFDSAMSVSFTGAINFIDGGEISTQNKYISEINIGDAGSNINVNLASGLNAGAINILDVGEFTSVNKPINSTGAFNITANAVNFNVTLGTSAITAADMSITTSLGQDGTITGTPTINISSSFGITKTGDLTYNIGSAAITLGTASTLFNGAGQTFKYVSLSGGTTTLNDSNTFGTLAVANGKMVKFESGGTTTLGVLNATGIEGSLIDIRPTNLGTAFTLSKSSGTVDVNYIYIKDSIATGGAVFNAGIEGYDQGGNSGWNFTRNAYAMTQKPYIKGIVNDTPKNYKIEESKPKFEAIIGDEPKFKVLTNL